MVCYQRTALPPFFKVFRVRAKGIRFTLRNRETRQLSVVAWAYLFVVVEKVFKRPFQVVKSVCCSCTWQFVEKRPTSGGLLAIELSAYVADVGLLSVVASPDPFGYAVVISEPMSAKALAEVGLLLVVGSDFYGLANKHKLSVDVVKKH